MFINRFSSRNSDDANSEYVEYNPQNIENILLKFHRMNKQVSALEHSLKDAEEKSTFYENLFTKFKSIFNEELALFKLYKSHIFLLNQTVRENELFIKELDRELKEYFDSPEHDVNERSKEKFTSFKRVILRFFHQNNMTKSMLKQKLSDLNESIEHKNKLLEKIQEEIQTYYNPPTPLNLQKNELKLKQAVG